MGETNGVHLMTTADTQPGTTVAGWLGGDWLSVNGPGPVNASDTSFTFSLGFSWEDGSDVDARRRRPARIPSAASKGCDKEAGTDDGVDRNSGFPCCPGEEPTTS